MQRHTSTQTLHVDGFLVVRSLLLVLSLGLVLGASDHGSAQARKLGAVAGHIDLGGADPSDVGVVVYLEAEDANVKSAPVKGQVHKVVQRGKQFEPRLLVVPVGTTVEFPNEDHIFHNVFSLSSTERFDLGLYKSGMSKSVTFRREGAIDIYCNIHPEMAAQVLVLDTPYHSIVGRDGKFRIADVAPGKYTMVVWQRYQEPLRKEITVTAGGTVEQRMSMQVGRRPRRHLKKDGQPYGRYR